VVIADVGTRGFGGDRRGFQMIGGSADVLIERTVLTGNLQSAMTLDRSSPVQRAAFRDNVWTHGQYGVIATGAAPGTASLSVGAPGAVWERMVFVGPSRPRYPNGTGFVGREADAFTAYRVRSAVDSATTGVVPP
jgi:hypothetical protein